MSPVIILGLVLMWACVLVPMWLRRHDEVEENRSVDRFSTAMHTLSRRESRADERYVVVPHRTRSMDVHVSGASAPAEEPAPRVAQPDRPAARVARPARPVRPSRPPHRSLIARVLGAVVILAHAGFGLVRRAVLGAVAAVVAVAMIAIDRVRGRERRPLTAALRRRRTLIGLLLASFATLALAVVVGGLPLWLLQGMVDVALGAFVWHLYQRGRQAAAVVRQRRRAAAATRVPAPLAEPVRRSAPMSTPVPFVQPEPAVVAEPLAEPIEAVEAQELPLTAEARAGSWEPVHVPPPTYTMKPAAPARPPRTTEYADYSEPLVPPAAEDRNELDDTADLGEILDQRWAVND
jgi:hypothetical protein